MRLEGIQDKQQLGSCVQLFHVNIVGIQWVCSHRFGPNTNIKSWVDYTSVSQTPSPSVQSYYRIMFTSLL